MTSYNNGKGAHGTEIYYGLATLAQKHDISWKEAEETVLRVALRKMGVMPNCDHLPGDIIVRRDGSRPHCRKCWTWMQMLSRPSRDPDSNFKGTFRPIKSEFEKEVEKTLHFTIGADLK